MYIIILYFNWSMDTTKCCVSYFIKSMRYISMINVQLHQYFNWQFTAKFLLAIELEFLKGIIHYNYRVKYLWCKWTFDSILLSSATKKKKIYTQWWFEYFVTGLIMER